MTETLARRAVARSVAEREAAYTQEMQRVVDATYQLIEQTGSFEPSLREILAQANLSTQAFYRYFRSKDELMLALFDDGRHRLADALVHRMGQVPSPEAKVAAWVDGVLAQAGRPKVAAQARPFVVNEGRLAELFPNEHQTSVDLLTGLLVEALADVPEADRAGHDIDRDAEAIYLLTVGVLHKHLVHHTAPSPDEVDTLVRFALRGTGLFDA